MTEMVMRSRIAALVVVALLSVSGAFGTAAFLTADDAHAKPPYPYCTYYNGAWHCYG